MEEQNDIDIRRAFLAKAVAGGLIVSLPVLNATPARAGNLEDCSATCLFAFNSCKFGLNENAPA